MHAPLLTGRPRLPRNVRGALGRWRATYRLAVLGAGAAFAALAIGLFLHASHPAPAAQCSDGFVIWSHGQAGTLVVDISGSTNTFNGKVHSNRDFLISGSTNNITGVPSYVTTFKDNGATNTYPAQQQVAADKVPPRSFNVADYQPGGARADVAAGADSSGVTPGNDLGNYHVRSGSPYVVTSTDLANGGLLYATGDVNVPVSSTTSTITIVAEGVIDVSGSSHNYTHYIDGLLFFSAKTDKTRRPSM
jgi:hypothetical protein